MREKAKRNVGKIVLASNSPRRRDIMAKQTDYYFEVIPSTYDEKHTTTVFSFEYIESLAYNKAFALLSELKEESLVIGADTVVVLGGEILGKPKSYEDAFIMLKNLSGKQHKVVTSVVVINSRTKECRKKSTVSTVDFESLTDEQIKFYIDNYKPYDKAGSYGIQEMPKGYIKSYNGSLENIIGLPSDIVISLIESFNKNE